MPKNLVFAFPARRNADANPYTKCLADALQRRGWHVVDPSRFEGLSRPAAVVHLHWPQQIPGAPSNALFQRMIMFLSMAFVQRALGARFVWTAHNVVPHYTPRPKLEAWFMNIIVRLLDGMIYLNASSRDRAHQLYPKLATLPDCIVPHGTYGNAYPPSPTRIVARTELGLDPAAEVVGFLGDVRSYKGLHDLLDTLIGADPRFELLIAGFIGDGSYGAEIFSRIARLRDAGWRIHVTDRRLGDNDLVTAIAACSAVVFPYTSTSTSGMAVLTAERGGHVIAPATPGFDEIEQQLAGRQITRAPRIDSHTIMAALDAARAEPDAAGVAAHFRSENDWNGITRTIDALYRKVLA